LERPTAVDKHDPNLVHVHASDARGAMLLDAGFPTGTSVLSRAGPSGPHLARAENSTPHAVARKKRRRV